MEQQVKLTIDGVEVTARPGMTVLQAAQQAGIYIPTLCWHPALRPWGACRMCVVEVERQRGYPASCLLPVADGMVVRTNTDAVRQIRREIIEVLITEHPLGCLTCHKEDQCYTGEPCLRSPHVDFRCVTCPANYRCELQAVCDYVEISEVRFPFKYRGLPLGRDPLIATDFNLCIVCARCVRVCDEVRGIAVWAVENRGATTIINTAGGQPMIDAGCIMCGACVDVCPVGALEERQNRHSGPGEQLVRTVCNYCPVGCQFILEVRRGRLLRVGPDYEAPANQGQYCVRGRFGVSGFVHNPMRLQKPMVRKNGALVQTGWEEAVKAAVDALKNTPPEQVAIFSSSRLTTEELYALQKIARDGVGTPNLFWDLADWTVLEPLHTAFEKVGPTATIADIEKAQTYLVIGADPWETVPVVGMKIVQHTRTPTITLPPASDYFNYLPGRALLPERERASLILINPRPTHLNRFADVWVRVRPGTDAWLVAGMVKVILEGGLADADFINRETVGFHQLEAALRVLDLEQVSRITGVDRDEIVRIARLFARNRPGLIMFGGGVVHQGRPAVAALVALALVTGNVGRPGAGLLPLYGTANSQGALDAGAVAGLGPGQVHLDETPELDNVKTCYIVGDGFDLEGPDGLRLRRLLERCETVIFQGAYTSPLLEYATVVLPGVTFAEKDGTVTSLERRVQRVRAAVRPPGAARPDLTILAEIGQGLGVEISERPAEVFAELAERVPGLAGLDYDELEFEGPVVNPLPEAFKFPELSLKELEPAIDGLVTVYPGRSFYRYDLTTFPDMLKTLTTVGRERVLEVGPELAARLGLAEGQPVRVIGDGWDLVSRVRVSAELAGDAAFWDFEYVGPPAGNGRDRVPDPFARNPLARPVRVRLEPVAGQPAQPG
jgi:formate dehydrogenase major subunit/formate dehydrogenase alpha subunit